MWKFSKSLFICNLMISILQGLMPPLNAYMVKILIDYITVKNFQNSLYIIVTFAIINILNGAINTYLRKKIGTDDDLFKNSLIFGFTAKVAEMDYEILYNPITIEKKEMALKAIQENRAVKYLNISFSTISNFVSLISIFYLLSSFSWWLYIVIIIFSALNIVTVIFDKKHVINRTKEMVPINTKISYYYQVLTDENYANDMRMHSISNWIVHKYKICVKETHDIIYHLLSEKSRMENVRSVLQNIKTVIEYIYLAVEMIFRGMSFADFSLITSTLNTFSNAITNIARSFIDIGENSFYVQMYIDFMNIKNVIATPGEGTTVNSLKNVDMVYEISNVSFSYPGSSNSVFSDLNLKIQEGKFYVIVGKNGAGKTTLVRLLCRLYDVNNGCIKYMNEDIRHIEYKSYRENIGVVFQDYKYYCLTIAENIAMNEYDESEETRSRILDALYQAGLKDKIDSLPKGIDTQLGKIFDNEGVLLSGGELQKLALARVLFNNPPIVILDEPSSALDALAEDELIKTFNSALSGKTVFYISHRLSVAKYAEKVIYMENGKITGFDNHENLLKSSKTYRDMYEAQAKHYR